MTYADVLRPSAKRYALTYDAVLVLGGSVAMALSAQLAIPLPFSPVPVTGQTFAVLLIGALLGSRRGGLCVLAYLAEGAAGLPVFAAGTGGLLHLTGPTGGYLAGFVVAALVTGFLAERGWDRRFWTTIAAMLLGNIAIYGYGLPWLAFFVGAGKALPLGLKPFIAGDIYKLLLAAVLLPSGWKVLGHIKHR